MARGRTRTTKLELNETEQQMVVNQFRSGGLGVVAIAKEFNVQPTYVSNLLKSQGIEIARGRRFGSTSKQVLVVSPETITALVNRYNEGTKIVALSREFNIPQAIVSAQLKANGIIVKRGKPSTKNLVTA